MGKINILVVEPHNAPYKKEIDCELKVLQQMVGGFIEATYPYDDPVALICNEEAKLEGLPLNRALRDEDDYVYDIVAGTFMIVGLGEEDFDSLSDELTEKYMELFRTPEEFAYINDKIIVMPM